MGVPYGWRGRVALPRDFLVKGTVVGEGEVIVQTPLTKEMGRSQCPCGGMAFTRKEV